MKIVGCILGLAILLWTGASPSGLDGQEKKPNPLPTNSENLLGTWTSKQTVGPSVVISFKSMNLCRIQVGNDVGEGSYSVDWQRKPAHLDLDLGKVGIVKTIMEMTSRGLRVENNDPGKDRPGTFTEKAFLLTRMNEKK